MAKSIKLNLFFNILLNISKVIFPLITAPYVARVLSPEGVGLFNFSNTYAGYFALFAVLGIPMYSVREIAKIRDDIKKQENFLSEIISLSVFSTMVTTIIFVGSIFVIPQLNENYILFLLSGLLLYFVPLQTDWFFSGREEFGYITLRSLIIRTISILLLFLFVKQQQDLIIYILINGFSQVLNNFWNFAKIKKLGIHPHFTVHCFKHLKSLLLLFSSTVAISFYTILDTLMLGFMSDYSQVGFYNSATHISKSLLPVVTSLAAVVMPRLSYYMSNGNYDKINDLMDKSLSIVSFLCFPITLGVISISPVFVPLFFGNEFIDAILPLQIVICTVVAIGLSNLLGVQVLVGMGHDKMFLYSLLSGTIFNFIFNIIFIPTYGAIGASCASVIAEFIIVIVDFIVVYKYTSVRFHKLKEVFLSLLIALSFIPLMYLLSNFISGWGLVIVFIIFGGLSYLLLQYLAKNSTEMLFLSLIKEKIKNISIG